MTISANSSTQIWKILRLAEARHQQKKIAVLGVGNELNGDDAAGVALVRRLQQVFPDPPGQPGLILVEGGLAPQNFTGLLRKEQVELVVMVDAAQMDLHPGEAALLDVQDLDGISASTHTFPLSMLVRYLQEEIGCEVGLVGIQPASNEPFSSISEEVSAAVEQLAAGLLEIFAKEN